MSEANDVDGKNHPTLAHSTARRLRYFTPLVVQYCVALQSDDEIIGEL
ncbi:hypothetical protein KA005_33795 [bacterium]|nr:hypothetical protein [bacterium]